METPESNQKFPQLKLTFQHTKKTFLLNKNICGIIMKEIKQTLNKCVYK